MKFMHILLTLVFVGSVFSSRAEVAVTSTDYVQSKLIELKESLEILRAVRMK